jgi:hypothetical protein
MLTTLGFSAFIKTLIDDADAATARATLGAVGKADFNANTILAADTDDTPAALTVAEQRIVGRKTGGNIAALYAADVLSILLASTVAGDLPYFSATNTLARLPKGTDGQIIKQSSGLPSWAWGGKVVQVVNYQTGAVATGTTAMPLDDTIPQKTEGDEYMTLAITPKSASNLLLIIVNAVWTLSAAYHVCIALFQDDIANALAANSEYAGASYTHNTTLVHYMTAGTINATTFKVRIGTNSTGTLSFNGFGGNRIFGGVAASSISIIEIAA